MTLPARNDMPDWAVRETAAAKAQSGTHLAADAAPDALFISRGTGTLGAGNDALDARAGAALIDSTRVSLDSETPVDIREGGGQHRRDVVYLRPDGVLAVEEGPEGEFAWSDGLDEERRTIANAYRPAPPDMVGIEGYPLAVITVPRNANGLSTQAIHELRAPAPVAGIREGADIELGSVGTPGGQTNRVWQLDPDIDDFGVAVNQIDEQASPGDRIEVPPVGYNCDTTAEITTSNVALVGMGNVVGHRLYEPAKPHVFKTSDVLMLRVSGNGCSVKGIGFDSDMNDSTGGIEMLGARPEITECSVKSMGADNIRLYQRDGRNLNNAVIERVTSNYADGDGVYIGAEANVSSHNTNAMSISLTESTGCRGWAINEDTYSVGNEYEVKNYTEPNDGQCEGGIRISAPYSFARILYWEGTGSVSTGIQFDTNVSSGEIVESGAEYDRFFAFNGSNPKNVVRQYQYPDQPAYAAADRLEMGDIGVPSIRIGNESAVDSFGSGLSVTSSGALEATGGGGGGGSVGYPTNETTNRSKGTWYQNTGTTALNLLIVYSFNSAINDGDEAIAVIDVNDTQSLNAVAIQDHASATPASARRTMTVTVPPDGYYQFRSTGAQSAKIGVNRWIEQS